MPEIKSVITVARQYGSGGRKIGQKLADKFGIPFYDRELIALAAKKSGISVEIYEKADEKAGGNLLYSLMMANYSFLHGVPMINDMPLNDKLFLLQAQIIREAAKKGPCVIVGRCADDVLKNEKNIFSIFICADKTARMERSVQEYGIDPKRAAANLANMDNQRAGYYNYFADRKWGYAENYQICVNSSAYGIDGTAELIADAAAAFENGKK